jgi:protoporphyrinogen/coproporphyrinogen III oxidase
VPSHVVIGGGITGLAACWYLAKAGHRPLLIERSQRLGGVIRTDVVEDCVLEGGPDSFLAAKPAAMELIAELGLEDHVISSNDHRRVTYIAKNGRLVPMPDGLMMMVPTKIAPLLSTPLLSWSTKCKMGLEYFRSPGPAPGERTVAEPLLSGVYGGDPEQLSADAVLGQFVELEKKYGSLTKGTLALRAQRAASSPGPLFRTLKAGMEQLISALVVQLAGRFERRQDEVRSVRSTPLGFELQLNKERILAENLFVCCPAPHAGLFLQELDAGLAAALNEIPYNSSVTVALGYPHAAIERPLHGFGFLIPKVERRRLVACTFLKNKFDHRVAADKVVLRCFLGNGALSLSDGEILSSLQDEIALWLGIRAVPSFTRIQRWDRAMAQYTLGHKSRIANIRALAASHPRLHLAGNAYDGIGIPDCIRSARTAAEAAS